MLSNCWLDGQARSLVVSTSAPIPLALLTAAMMSACAGKPSTGTHAASRTDGAGGVDHLQSELRRVDASDGVDANEARVIADMYFLTHISGCGATDEVVLRGRVWVVSLLVGVAGSPMDETVNVDAQSGGVSSSLGPRYSDLKAFRERVLTDASGSTRDLAPPSNPALQADDQLGRSAPSPARR